MEVRQLRHAGARFVAPLHGLVWIAQMSQAQRRLAEATYPGLIPSIEARQSAVLLEVIEAHTLLDRLSGGSKLSKPEQRVPQHSLGYQEESGVLAAPRQTEPLLP